jgi:hypothetical protein
LQGRGCGEPIPTKGQKLNYSIYRIIESLYDPGFSKENILVPSHLVY